MKFYILASGSKGNATVIQGPNTKILIDMGLSLTEYKNRLSVFSLVKEDISAVLYTHKHTDHVKPHFAKVADSVYAPTDTLPEEAEFTLVKPYVPFMVNEFKITPFATSHDTPSSVGYILETSDEKAVYVTDTGYLSVTNLKLMKDADLYIMEANHNTKMLLQTKRSFDLIQRILSDTGHLDNDTAAHYLSELIGPRTKGIVLAHLSEEANTPEVALETMKKIFRKYRIDQSKFFLVAAPQHSPLSGEVNED